MASATAYSICDLCGERHARGAPHIWKTPRSDAYEGTVKPEAVGGSINSPRRQAATPRVEKSNAGPGESPGAHSLPNVARGVALIAPPGKCDWCDARRAYTAGQMRGRRAKEEEPTP